MTKADAEAPDTLATFLAATAPFARIAIVGLQRSGTHVVAEILAHERDLPLYSERDFNYTSCTPGTDRIQIPIDAFIAEHSHFVLQAPAILHQAHQLARDNLLVVFVRRPADEVRASRLRSGWPGESIEREKYDRHEYAHLYEPDFDLVDKQLAVWEHVTKRELSHLIEVDFATFAEHPFWLKPEERAALPIGNTKADGNWRAYETRV